VLTDTPAIFATSLIPVIAWVSHKSFPSRQTSPDPEGWSNLGL